MVYIPVKNSDKRKATESQIGYIADLVATKNYKEKIDYSNLSMREAGRLIYKLKNIK